MGWIRGAYPTGTATLDAWADDMPASDTVLDAVVANGAVYAAIRDANGDVYAAVSAYDRLTRGPSWDRTLEIGFKHMTESMGPVQVDCPDRILDLLSPPETIYGDMGARHAAEWRDRCRATTAARKARRAAMPSSGDPVAIIASDTIQPEWASGATGTLVKTGRRHAVIDLPDGRVRVPHALLNLPATADKDDA